MAGIVAIGGGQASFSFVKKLKALGYSKRITLVCGENIAPYQRPPLSKKFLLGEMSKNQLLLRPENYYHDNNVKLVLGKQVVRLDRNQKISTWTINSDTAKYHNGATILLGHF